MHIRRFADVLQRRKFVCAKNCVYEWFFFVCDLLLLLFLSRFCIYNENRVEPMTDQKWTTPTASTTTQPHFFFCCSYFVHENNSIRKLLLLVMSLFVTYISSSVYRRCESIITQPFSEIYCRSYIKVSIHQYMLSYSWLFRIFITNFNKLKKEI